jgi:putative ABC transport system ATP-binding protein
VASVAVSVVVLVAALTASQAAAVSADAVARERVPVVEPGTPLIEVSALTRKYEMGDADLWALRGVSFSITPGENVAIMGPSGSGKSTLLHLLGLLDRPTSGSYKFAGVETSTLSDDNQARLRNKVIGFIFQSFNLIAGESALENVAAPLVYAGVKRKERMARASEALDLVGLGDRLHHDPSQLSGGQRQRAAIARALITNPPLLLADEPTGNLDSAASSDILELINRLHRNGLTVLTITHDPRIASTADRILTITDGEMVEAPRAQVLA